ALAHPAPAALAAPVVGSWSGAGAGPATRLAVVDRVGAARLRAETALAEHRLAVNARTAHPGHPEALAHPGRDGLGRVDPSTRARPASARAWPGAGRVVAAGPAPRPAAAAGGDPSGVDVSAFQPDVKWAALAAAGVNFTIVKATEGTYYTSPAFPGQYDGSRAAGLIRGAYHFAVPDNSSGAAQADFFVAHGGGWSGDGRTLPGMLDIEYNPYGSKCYGLTRAQMVRWVASFDDEYLRLTGRYPLLYTNAGWWDACTGGSSVAASDPLDLAAWGPSPAPLPGGWPFETMWQYTDSNAFGYDGDRFNGTAAGLDAIALGRSVGGPSGGSGGGSTGGGSAVTDLGTTLPPGRVMVGGEQLVAAGGRYRVVMQRDGNLVLYGPSRRALWAAGTAGDRGARLVMSAGGDLVVLDGGHQAWTSRTAGRGRSYAVVLSNGNFAVHRYGGGATWSSGTAGKT
ncbi:MAG: GH25 family lysozyme, partial [Acidimicrobiales bacterium]